MNKAIFLDRDGVLIDNHDNYYIWRSDQVKFVDGIFKNLQMIQQKGFQLFIVTNQGGISRSMYTKDDTENLHLLLSEVFRKNHVAITDILFCPHHNENGKCLCRKPESLMIEKLVARYGINKEKSFLIGDSQSDMNAASGAGIQGIRITANQNMFPFISMLIQ